MLKDTDSIATIAVSDLAVARRFYEDVLGFSGSENEKGVMGYRSGSASLMVYESQYAGTNKATSATWVLESGIEQLVADLKQKGVTFEHYDDLPGLHREGDLHVAGTFKGAWFKDPDGNILHVVTRNAPLKT